MDDITISSGAPTRSVVGCRRRRRARGRTHRDGTSAGDGEDGRIDRADVISSIGTAAREVIGRARARGRALIVDFDFDFVFDF